MKKLLVWLVAFCLLLPVCCAAETAAQETQTGEAGQTMTLHDVRYYFEHRLVRDYFFLGPEDGFRTFREVGPFYMWNWLADKVSFDVTYQESDFTFRETDRDGIHMLILEMPKPEQTLDCSRIWMCYEPETGNGRYFTVEYDNYFGEAWFLGEWVKTGEGDEDWQHMNYGTFDAADSSAEDYEAQLEAEADLIISHIRGNTQ